MTAVAVRLLDELVTGDPLTELDAAWEAAWAAVDEDVLRLCQRRMAMLLGHEPVVGEMTQAERDQLASWPSAAEFGDRERAALALTEQYLIDVAAATEEQIVAVADQLGPDGSVIDFINALVVVEQRMRLELGLSAVLGPS